MLQGACQAIEVPQFTIGRARLLAPPWHTQLLVGLMVAVAVTGTLLSQEAPQLPPTTAALWKLYLPLTMVNTALAAYVCRLGLPRNVLASLLGQGRYHWRRALGDVAVATALVLLILSAESGLQTLLGMPESTNAHALLPGSVGAKPAWLCVAALVGISEELVYRGYLQRQLGALTGRLSFGIALQAMLFGIAHGEQGAWAVTRFACYAVLLGWATAARRSLWPGMLCHVALDCYAGLSG